MRHTQHWTRAKIAQYYLSTGIRKWLHVAVFHVRHTQHLHLKNYMVFFNVQVLRYGYMLRFFESQKKRVKCTSTINRGTKRESGPLDACPRVPKSGW